MAEQQREFEAWVLGQFPGYALDEINPGDLAFARAAWTAALSHAEREIAARALDDFKSDVARWVRLLSDSDPDNPETRVLRKVNGWLHSRAKRLRAGKEGE